MDINLKLYNNKEDSLSKLISNYQKFNNNYISENENQKIDSLVTKNMNLSVKNEEQKKIINLLKRKERDCVNLQSTMTEKLKEIDNLNRIILTERKNHKEVIRNHEKNFESELLNRKREQDANKLKIDNFNKMNSLNDILYYKVLDLEKRIEELKKEEEMKMNQKDIEFSNKMDKYKKKLIDFLRRDKRKDQEEQISLLNKLNILHIQELIGEIEFQNQEITSLLKERKDLKIKIMNLTNDLNIYKIITLTLSQKNDDYQKKIKTLTNSRKDKYSLLFNSQKKISVTENEDTNNNLFDKKLRIYSPDIMKKNNILGLDLSVNNKKRNKNKFKDKTISNNVSPIALHLETINSYKAKIKGNEIYNEKKEKEKYKDLYEFYKDKYDIIIKKFNNLFEMYNNALEKIYNEEIDKNINDINININDFKGFKFEQMTPEQKYSILIKLINQIAPLICKKDFEENSFRNKVFKVRQKYNLLNRLNQSIFSQTQRSIELSEKMKTIEKNTLNSPGISAISSYISPESTKSEERKLIDLQKNNINKCNINSKNYSSLFKYSKSKGHISMSCNMEKSLFKSKMKDINNNPFASN